MLSPSVKRLVEHAPLLLPVLLLLPQGSYVAIFDGRVYADCIVQMATQPSWAHLTCAGHPTHAYILFTAAIQTLSPYSSWLMLASHLAMLLASLWAFQRILARLFPEPSEWVDRTLVLAAMAVNPMVLACTLQPNPDLALLAGALLVVEALLAKNRTRLVLAGLFLVFTKELGLLAFPTLVALYAITHITRSEAPWKEKQMRLAALWPAAIPLVAAAARLSLRHYTPDQALFNVPPTHSGALGSILSEFLTVQLLDPTFLSYATGIGILQFQWLLSLLLVAWIAKGVARWLFRIPILDRVADARSTTFVLGLFAAFFVLTTRYQTYSSPRYWVSVYPMMMLAAFAAARELRMPASGRQVFFGVVGICSLASVFHTIDPVSKKVYGTFAFGEHTMLRASSLSGYRLERLKGGRDALPYNLQFANIHHLQNAVFATLGNPNLPILVDRQNEWHLWDPLDVRLRRTLDPKGSWPVIRSRAIPVGSSVRLQGDPPGLPDTLVYVIYPMFEEYQRSVLSELSKIYRVETQTVLHDGYAAEIVSLRLDEERGRALRAPNDADLQP